METVSITLPASVPFPVTITALPVAQGGAVAKHQTIIKYKYWDYQDDPNSKDEVPPKIRVERIGTYESPVEGELVAVRVHVHDEVAHAGVEVCSIKEPCAHAVQYGGLCAMCGKAVEDEKDYSGYSYEDRATIAMSHDNTGLKISLQEAAKIESSTTQRLTEEKKLILVVDLDQTVIHATVDPTVGEWQADPSNPNYPAVKNVQAFCLEEEPIVPPGWTGPRIPPTKCWYYVKLRPGLEDFLKAMAKIYEMHIYTMATRNYALAIAKIIDPAGDYFGDRILSRDESGALTHKNLKRLFPVDQSMVVIIDDRGDVWQWESNLIKVVPYDFFVGIGDINSSFLPKKNGQITGPSKKRKSLIKLEAFEHQNEEEQKEEDVTFDDSDTNGKDTEAASPVERMLEIAGGEDNKQLLIEQSRSRSLSLEQQQHDRPLAKLQHDLEMINHDHETHSQTTSRVSSPPESDSESVKNDNDHENDHENEEDDEEDNLLYDDDNELVQLNKALVKIHNEYYSVLEKAKKSPASVKPDLTKIIPALKSSCLKGITILFSGIIPLGINADSADIVIWCKQFGVNVVNEVYPSVTHVVCRDPNNGAFRAGFTFKVRAAKKLIPNVKIVNSDWLFACLSSWSHVDEQPYLINDADEDWFVNEEDIERYQTALELKKEKEQTTRARFDSITSLEGYDMDEANQEVDEFLAGISGDEDEDEDGDEDGDDDEEEEQSNVTNGDRSFIKDAYANKKKRKYEQDDQEDEPTQNDGGAKKAKAQDDVDFDELEQEILDGFDDLEED